MKSTQVNEWHFSRHFLISLSVGSSDDAKHGAVALIVLFICKQVEFH